MRNRYGISFCLSGEPHSGETHFRPNEKKSHSNKNGVNFGVLSG